ncbi:hypothetical protein ATANTOWER_005685 [Ataeniobius toweri]|uniref:Uncharacterized protein n=1 Tax=Ataeniobius toweri TaxID=208326 RepID=A0ABU7B1G0_9TELE|nr:hypothetical protein [Ataeniobius toweri]
MPKCAAALTHGACRRRRRRRRRKGGRTPTCLHIYPLTAALRDCCRGRHTDLCNKLMTDPLQVSKFYVPT